MKSVLLKNILAAGILGAIACSIGFAQTAPNAEVDPVTGELILKDGSGNETGRVGKPAGEVVDGSLVLPGQSPIAAPNGQVQNDGSLFLPDSGTTFPAPMLPVDLFFTRGKIPVPGYYWSNIIATYYDLGSLDPSKQGWIFIEKWGGVDPASGWFWINTRTSEEAMWCYSIHFQSWVYFYVGENGFKRLSSPADFQTFAAFFVASPPADIENWHVFNSNTTQASYRKKKISDGSIEWVPLQ